MEFLSSLGSVINKQFGIGENSYSQDQADNVSKLFSNATDPSAERTYMEDGFLRDLRPRERAIKFQQPDFYIVIKKRMFSSLIDNSRLDLLEKKERLLIAASKKLFQNKCKLISFYEKLTKIEKETVDNDRFNTFLGPSLLNLLDSGDLIGLFDLNDTTKSAIDTLRKVLSYSTPESVTTWTANDWDSVFSDEVGDGPGTFELTNVSSIKTTVSTEWQGGSAQLILEDPYNILTITEKDIDQALAEVTNPLKEGSFFKFTQIELQNRINELKSEFNNERISRGASNVTFIISPGTLISSRVRAIIDDEGTEIKFNYSTGIQEGFDALNDADGVFDTITSSLEGFFSTGSVQIESEFLDGNQAISIKVNNQLTSSERQKFSEIISNIYTLLAQNATSKSEVNKQSQEVNYARNRMRLFFNGKFAIQPMDVISIFMNSRTSDDDRMPGGYSSQQNQTMLPTLQRFDSIMSNINSTLLDLRDPYGSFNKTVSFDDIERQSIVGPDMPKWLWKQFKQDITSQPTGPCIFTGIVGGERQGVRGSWSDGKWTISISCEDNAGYFNKSQVNFQPAADVFNSSIYDPLTPFDLSFDASTGVALTDVSEGDIPPLLPENQELIRSGVLTFASGPNKGKSVTMDRYTNDKASEISFDQFRQVLHNPEGLVYRWKQGIQTLTFSGRPYPKATTDQNRTVLLTKYEFAGQDIMNVLSLLITGAPYNFSTFLKAAIANGNSLATGNDPTLSSSSTNTFIQGLLADIEKNNLTWGNFVPYKKLVMNSSVNALLSQTRIDAITANQKLQQKLNELAKAEDELLLLQTNENIDPSAAFSIDESGNTTQTDEQNSFNTLASASAQQKITSLTKEISQLQSNFDDIFTSNQDVGLTVIGRDVETIGEGSNNTEQQQRFDLELRKNLQKYTARRFWKVKANEDSNLFIVDDQYDKNFDILAFERKIGKDITLFNSQYSSIQDQITSVKKLLGLEVFANTQGHIEARPPLYNKMPSSVFYKMFEDRDKTGVKVFPDFLESLYFNQSKGILNNLSVIEDEIRLRAIALGAKNENEIEKMVATNSDGTFAFITDENGAITNLPQIFAQSDPDFSEDQNNQAVKQLNDYETVVTKQSKINNLFTISAQAELIINNNTNVFPDLENTNLETIRERIQRKTGRKAKTINELFGNDSFYRRGRATSSVDRLNIITQMSSYVSERQILLKSLSNAIKSLKEGVSVNASDNENSSLFQGGTDNLFKQSNSNKAVKAVTSPSLYRNTEIPQFLEHMIEYENVDDLGPNAGRRFIITPEMVVSLSISEVPPPYTMVTINGRLAEGFIEAPGSFKTSNDGNGITSAYAVDYDMWYQYGFRSPKAIEAPFLNDPDSQCAPFAYSALLEARENILQGSVDVVGYNEYYQPGDVVYIEDRGLLFYVKSVSHSCNYSNLTTTLELTYGHNPGEYIPTMLDVVGKILYNAKGFTGKFRNERFQMLGGAKSLGALSFVKNISVTDDIDNIETRMLSTDDYLNVLLKGSQGERNKKVLTNLIYSTSDIVNKVKFNTKKARIKLVYYKILGNEVFASEMLSVCESIRDWLIYPEKNTSDGLSSAFSATNFGLNDSDIVIEEVDLTYPEDQIRQRIYPTQEAGNSELNTQGPSSAAIALTRMLAPEDIKSSEFKILLTKSVIDLFVDYEDVEDTVSDTLTSDLSAAEQASNEAIAAAKSIGRN